MPLILAVLFSVNLTPSVLTVPVETPQDMAVRIATEHHLSVKRFLKVIDCESKWDTTAVGDHGTSFGLVQLHNVKRDWGLTKEDAFDPETALETMASAWDRNEQSRWSCWNLYYGDS